jgi:hypothetical protein
MSTANETGVEASPRYWLHYWCVYALVQALDQVCLIMFGRQDLTRGTAEVKLLFFVYIFGKDEWARNSPQEDGILAEELPLEVLYHHATPIVLDIYSSVSEVISPEVWTMLVTSKTGRILDLCVTVRLISESWKDWISFVFDGCRPLVPPMISLLPVLPSFATRVCLVYVQYLVPIARSVQTQDQSASELECLQYWILHCFFSAALTCCSFFFWWIPFYSHFIYIFWCHLTFPNTIESYYCILETDLVSLGILKGERVLAVHETRTAQFLTAIIRLLPSGLEDDDFQEALDETKLQPDATETSNQSLESDSVCIQPIMAKPMKALPDVDDQKVKVLAALIKRVPHKEEKVELIKQTEYDVDSSVEPESDSISEADEDILVDGDMSFDQSSHYQQTVSNVESSVGLEVDNINEVVEEAIQIRDPPDKVSSANVATSPSKDESSSLAWIDSITDNLETDTKPWRIVFDSSVRIAQGVDISFLNEENSAQCHQVETSDDNTCECGTLAVANDDDSSVFPNVVAFAAELQVELDEIRTWAVSDADLHEGPNIIKKVALDDDTWDCYSSSTFTYAISELQAELEECEQWAISHGDVPGEEMKRDNGPPYSLTNAEIIAELQADVEVTKKWVDFEDSGDAEEEWIENDPLVENQKKNPRFLMKT